MELSTKATDAVSEARRAVLRAIHLMEREPERKRAAMVIVYLTRASADMDRALEEAHTQQWR